MRRHLVVAGSFTLLLANATGVAAAHDDEDDDGHHGARAPVTVAAGLDNPRQLNWLGNDLMVAQGGRGGENCDESGACSGFTGRIGAIDRPFRTRDGEAQTLVDGLFSVLLPGLGAVGSDGVAPTGFPDVLLIAEGEPLFDELAPPGFETSDPAAETQEHLLVSVDGEVIPWVDFGAIEADENPDGAQIDSNPNNVIVVDPTPGHGVGEDEFALVADAGANTVWKVDPDFGDLDANGLPRADVSVFVTYPTPPNDEATPEFVPSSLDQDEHGNIYVGGVGSLVPGAAEVRRYTTDGEETGRWGGFTGINGLAVDRDGKHVYVSQIVGSDADFENPFSGSVVRFDTEAETYVLVDIPRPSGLALGEDAAWMNRRHHHHHGDDDGDDAYRSEFGDGYGGHHGRHHRLADTVFVSAFSQSTGEDDPATDAVEGGQVQRFSFPKHADETPLPVTPPGTGGSRGEPAP